MRQSDFAPVMPFDFRTEPTLVLDLSIASPFVSAEPRENTEPLVTARVNRAMRDAGVRVAIGRYNEPRLLYSTPLFAGTEGPLDERRTIHLGLDIFADAGTPVFAPLRGTVHAFADNRAALDYGPVIILRHATDDGTEFFSLYGHLSRDSLAGLTVGRTIERGETDCDVRHRRRQWWLDTASPPASSSPTCSDSVPMSPASHARASARHGSVSARIRTSSSAFRRSCFQRSRLTSRRRWRARRRLLGHNLSIAYRDPLKIVRGRPAVSVRRRRPPIHRRLQQRAARRTRAPARRRGGPAADVASSTRTRAT